MRQFVLLTLVSIAVTVAVFAASRVGEIWLNVGNQLTDILGSF